MAEDYDNVELNKLINDLKGIGSGTEKTNTKRNVEVKFQYSTPQYSSFSANSNRLDLSNKQNQSNRFDSMNRLGSLNRLDQPIKSTSATLQLENKSYKIKEDQRRKQYEDDNRFREMDYLQTELSIVKNELAELKRSQSLANHPIFSSTSGDSGGPYPHIKEQSQPSYSNNRSVTHQKIQSSYSDLRQNTTGNQGTMPLSYKNSQNSKNIQYYSLTRLNSTPVNYGHQDHMTKFKHDFSPKEDSKIQITENYYEDTVDCSLKPIGKGIQTLSGSYSSVAKTESQSPRIWERQFNSNISHLEQLRNVKTTKDLWLKLDCSKEECQKILMHREAGSFMIRMVSECKLKFSSGLFFELIVKTSENEYGSSYNDDYFECFTLKEISETNQRGIKLIGHAIEPMFPSLESFVLQHLQIPLALPCCLKLPRRESIVSNNKQFQYFSKSKLSIPLGLFNKKTSGSLTSLSSIKSNVTVATYAEPSRAKMDCSLLFLGKVRVDRLRGQNALRHAVDKVLINGVQPKHCIEVSTYLDSFNGITLVDNERIMFFKKELHSSEILYCGVDPLHRGLQSDFLSSNGIKNAKIFGVVCQKRKVLLKEHIVYIFSELNPKFPVEDILRFIQNNIICKNSNEIKF